MKKLITFFKQSFCKHEFKGKDMSPRDELGMVKWPCHKCKKLFVAEYGLKILENGKCVGEWGF